MAVIMKPRPGHRASHLVYDEGASDDGEDVFLGHVEVETDGRGVIFDSSTWLSRKQLKKIAKLMKELG